MRLRLLEGPKVRKQILLTEPLANAAASEAARREISLSEMIRRTVAAELGERFHHEPRPGLDTREHMRHLLDCCHLLLRDDGQVKSLAEIEASDRGRVVGWDLSEQDLQMLRLALNRLAETEVLTP